MSGSQERASGTNDPLQHVHVPGGTAAVAEAQHGASGIPSGSPHQSRDGASSEDTPDVITGRAAEAAREPAEAEGQPAGQLGDLPDKPGHLATAEQCRLANGGVCWHLLQIAVRARQIAQKSEDDSVSLPCKCPACMAYMACMACMASGGLAVLQMGVYWSEGSPPWLLASKDLFAVQHALLTS